MTSPRSNVFTVEPSLQALLRDLGVRPRAVLRRAEPPEDLFSQETIGLSTPDDFRLWTGEIECLDRTVRLLGTEART